VTNVGADARDDHYEGQTLQTTLNAAGKPLPLPGWSISA